MLTSVIVTVTFVILFSVSNESLAHPFYVESTPMPFQNIPKSTGEVSVFFSEPIELPFSEISVLGPNGKRVDKNDPHNVQGQTPSLATGIEENLPSGVYTVNTKVLSAVDGHVVDNSFTFGIGTETGSGSVGNKGGSEGTLKQESQKDILSPEESASRFPGYVGQVIAFGIAVAMLWLWRPFGQIPLLSKSLFRYRSLISGRVMVILIIGSSMILISCIMMIIVQAISVDASIQEIFSTKFGNVLTVRIIQSSVLTLVAVGVRRKINRKDDTQMNKAENVAVLALALSLLITYSLIAHAAASGQPLAILADFCHSVVASIWIGGLIFLAFAAIPKLRSLEFENRIKAIIISLLIPRFSTIVVVALGIILITGPLLLWTLENDLDITLASLYGKVLVVKLSIGSVMIAMGGYHQFLSQKKLTALVTLSRRVATNTTGDSNGSDNIDLNKVNFERHLKRFDRTLKIEAALGIGLLIMVSLMANMALPSGEFPAYERLGAAGSPTNYSNGQGLANALENEVNSGVHEFSQTAYLDSGQKIQLSIKPFTLGQNMFEVSFFDTDNSISRFINSSVLKLTQVEKGIGPIVVETTEQSPGKFRADAAFSLAGEWSVEVEGETTRPGMPNTVAIFTVQVKPRISDLQFTVQEYETPQQSLPLYPIYDPIRRAIWVGDSMPGSARIWEFDIESKNYTSHPMSNASLITMTALGKDGQIWYIDPTRNILGNYDPLSEDNQQFTIPLQGITSAMTITDSYDIWLVVGGQSNNIARFSPASNEFTIYDIPTPNSLPTDIAVDREGKIWFTESIGKIGRLDPGTGTITEYQPSGDALEEPTSILPDPRSSQVLVSEHEGQQISILDPILNTFSEYSIISDGGLPFGMALDDYGNLWFAQHVIDRIGLIDPENNQITEVQVPTNGSFVQWLVPDDQGRIWFAEQRGSSLGAISIILKPNSATINSNTAIQKRDLNEGIQSGKEEQAGIDSRMGSSLFISGRLGFGFADILGPLIAAGIIFAAFLYSKNVIEVRRNIQRAIQDGGAANI